MADKKILAVTALLVVGAATVLLLDQKTETFADPRLGQTILDGTTALGADKLEIKKDGKTLVLVKDDGNVWRLGDAKGFPVEAGKVVRLMDELARAKLTMVVATSKDAFDEFGLGSPTSVVLSGHGKELAAAALGTPRKGGGQYVAVAGEAKAYLADQVVSPSPDADAWELKSLLDLEKADVKSLAYFPIDASAGAPVTLSREKAEDPLKVVGLKEPQTEKPTTAGADGSVAGVTFAKRLDKGNEEAKGALAKPAKTFVTMFDGRTYEILVGSLGTETKRWFMTVNADQNGATLDPKKQADLDALKGLMASYAFEVPAHVAQRFSKGSGDFVESPPPAPKG